MSIKLARVDVLHDDRGYVLVTSLMEDEDEDLDVTQVELVMDWSERAWLVAVLLRTLVTRW